MKKKDVFLLLNKIYGNSIDDIDKDIISDKILLYDKYISLSPISLLDVLDNFVKMNKISVLNKIDDNLFVLMKRLLGFSKNNKLDEYDGLYFLDYLKYMIVPYNLLDCDKEYDLPKFLGEFEIFITLILDHAKMLDLEMIKIYNEDLYKLIKFKKEKEMELINSNKIKFDFQNIVIMETTLDHMLTIFYLKLDIYHRNYDILSNGYDIIYGNIDKLIEYCKVNNLYMDILSNNYLVGRNVLDEYDLSKKILDGLNEENKKKVKK